MLGKMDGTWAPKPSSGPHKERECFPLILILRNRLKYALTGAEANAIAMSKLVKVDGKVRTDVNFPTGFQDVVELKNLVINSVCFMMSKVVFNCTKSPMKKKHSNCAVSIN